VSSSVLSPPKHRYGPSSASAAGVLSIIAGVLSLLFGTITLATSSSTLPRALYLAVGGLMMLLGSLGIATGWGLLERSRWAQVAAIMWAIELVSPSPPLPADVAGWVGELISIGIGIWWLMLFTGKAADEEFTSDSLGVPAAVLAVSWLLMLDLLSVPIAWLWKTPTFFYGHRVFVPYSQVLSTSLCFVSFVLGFALLKKSRLAFWLAFGLQVFRFTNSLVLDLTPSAAPEINREIANVLSRWQITGFSGIGRTFSFIEPAVMGVCLLLFWKRYKTSSYPTDYISAQSPLP